MGTATSPQNNPTQLQVGKWLGEIARQLYVPLLGIFTALLVGAIIIVLSGFNPLTAYSSLFQGAFGNLERLNGTLGATTPYIFTTLAVILAFKAGLFNIGAEGQLKMAALAAAWAGITFGGLPFFVAIPITLACGMLAGGLWGALPGALKAYFGAHEVIVTIMLNYIATFFTSYMVGFDGPMRGNQMTQTFSIGENARVPTIFDFDFATGKGSPSLPLHFGAIIAVAAAIFIYWLLKRTPLGFEIRTVGLNASAARYAGISVKRITITTMAAAGVLAGLAGTLEVMGNPNFSYRYSAQLGGGYGFNSIAIALLAKNSPIAAIPAGLLFAALQSGASKMQFDTIAADGRQIPGDLISIIQALVIIFVSAEQVIRWLYRLPESRGENALLASGWGSEVKRKALNLFASLPRLFRSASPFITGAILLLIIFVVRTISNGNPLIDVLAVVTLALNYSTPITLGALSGLMSERSGIVNIGIEGMMVTGAFFGALGTFISGSVWVGFIVAPIAGALVALLHAVLSIYFRVDQIISGTVINILSVGATSFLLALIISSSKTQNTNLGTLPSLGFTVSNINFSLGLVSLLAIALVFVVHYVLFYTSWGLRTRAVGENPKAADTAGVNVYQIQYINLLVSGALAALGGTYFSLQVVGYFREGMTVGSGFIALAAMIFGKWTPFGAWGAALLFGFCQALDGALQTWYGQVEWLHTITQSLPYVVTIIVLTGIIGTSRPPAAVGVPYIKTKKAKVAAIKAGGNPANPVQV